MKEDNKIILYQDDNEFDSSDQLEPEQKEILKQLYNKAVDNIKDYCQECLRIDGRLID